MSDSQQIPGPFAEWLRGLERGEKTIPNCEGERHHYTPEFLLKKFRGPGRRLFQLDKTDGSCEEVAAKEAAWDRNLYAVESDTGEHNGIVEGFFSVAEGFAAPSLSLLLNAPARFTDADRGNLAFLLAIQEQRAPGWLEEFEQRLSEMATVAATVELANVAGPKGKRRRAREAAEAIVEGAVTIKPSRENLLSTSLMGISYTLGPAYWLPWTVLRAKQGAFICSDRPLTMHDPTPPHKFSGAAWMSSELAVTSMPLGSKACLRICPSDRDCRPFGDRSVVKQVDRINLRTYGWATRFVYGPSADVLEALHARALADPEAVPVPAKKRLVMLEDLSTADPEVAVRNAARGWDRYVTMREKDGSYRLVSYEVIDSLDDARRSVAPRRLHEDDGEKQWASALDAGHPAAVHRHVS
jgi:hypothetical protein